MHKKTRQKIANLPPVTLNIHALSHEGRGIAYYGDLPEHNSAKAGKKVFVQLALKGEQVIAKVEGSYSKYEEAEVLEIVHSAPERTSAPCPHFGVCGGCSLQHMQVSAQVAHKQSVLAEQLSHFGGIAPLSWLPPLLNPLAAYRRKARLGVRYVHKKEKLLLGFRERKSGYLAELASCKVLDAQIGERLQSMAAMLERLQAREHIPQLEVAVGDDNVAIIIRHLVALTDTDVAIMRDYFAPLGWQWYLQPDGYGSVHRMDDPTAPMRLHYHLPDFGLKFAFSPLDFTQVNPAINAAMVRLACDLLELKPGERVLDLFCGLGNFSLPLATCVGPTGSVVAVEGSSDMVARGSENATLNQLHNVQFYAQDLNLDFSGQSWAAQKFDALLIDPPRSGAETVMRYLAKFGAARLVYVSCNPATLARDAGILAEQGYVLTQAGVMDMFTHTSHVESIALFVKK